MKTVIYKVLLLLISLLSISLFGNSQTEKRIFVGGGATFQNIPHSVDFPTEKDNPYIYNQFGLKFIKHISPKINFMYGASFIQARYKFESYIGFLDNSTNVNSYLSMPLSFEFIHNFSKSSIFIDVGLGVDFYCYNRIRTNTEDNLTFTITRLIYANKAPISLHFDSSIGTKFNIGSKHKMGLALDFQIMELASFYGRNYSQYFSSEKTYYYPINLSLSLSYYFGGKAKGEE